MRVPLVSVPLLVLVGTVAGGATVEQELRTFHEQLAHAMDRNDVQAITALCHPDFVSTNSDGTVMTRAQLLGFLMKIERSPEGTQDTSEHTVESDVRVRVFGTVAVLTGQAERIVDRKPFLRSRFTEVWLLERGQWRAIAWQSSNPTVLEVP